MSSGTVKVTGTEQAIKRLKALTGAQGKRAARRALRRGANVMRDAARVNAARVDDPMTRENIAKNIMVQAGGSRRERRVDGVMMRVGVRGGARNMEKYGEFRGEGKGNPGGDTWYWRLLEFGTEKMAAQPILRPAMTSSAQAATDAFAGAFGAEIDKELAKVK